MTINSIRTVESKFKLKQANFSKDAFPLIKEYGIDAENIPVVCDFELKFTANEKKQIIEKLLEAHKLALSNIKAGNITKRGFGANIMTDDNHWSIGTNFNNTRNDVSSVCAERSAILSGYNDALIRFSKQNSKKFDFKIKYICMVQAESLLAIKNGAIPCEDCLSWLNTTRYFDNDTLIISFECPDDILNLKVNKLIDFLPCRNFELSGLFKNNKTVKYSTAAYESIEKYNFNKDKINELIILSKDIYNKNSNVNISGQNIVCSMRVNDKVYSASKIDWTKRWFVEPLEFASAKAIEKEGNNCKISAICYFGDNFSTNSSLKEKYNDGGISIKSLGRVRQKYASADTLLILNLEDFIYVMTIGEYLPKKFIQGYKII